MNKLLHALATIENRLDVHEVWLDCRFTGTRAACRCGYEGELRPNDFAGIFTAIEDAFKHFGSRSWLQT